MAEGFRRFVIGKPELKEDTRFGGWRVHFPLVLTPEEQKRMDAELGPVPTGVQRSYRTTYRPSLKLGWVADGQFHATMLVDFLVAALGAETGKKFRKWVEGGGGPRRPDDPDDQRAELELIEQWLSWWEGLEIFGTITHSEPDKSGRIWTNFAGPMAVGSLPNQPEEHYQAHCRGQYRAMRIEVGDVVEAQAPTPPQQPSLEDQLREELAKARAAAAAAPTQPGRPRDDPDDF